MRNQPAFLQSPLAREITLAVAIKLLLLAAIFYAFFDGHTLNPDADAVAKQLANPNPPTQSHSGSDHAD